MPAKTIPLSVRVSDRDAEFIAGLRIEGATTPSEKLRAIIAQARLRAQGAEDFESGLRMMEEILGPVQRQLRAAEHELKMHSEIVGTVSEWLTEAASFLMAEAPFTPSERAEATRETLKTLEAGLADRVFRLLEKVLRLGVTRQCPCYDGQAVRRRLDPVLEVARLILANRQNLEEGRS